MNATTLARNLVRQLIEYGVCDFVLSPGSRNAPLSIALYQAESAGLINLYVRIDERGAAFFALGLSKASDNFVAVICTSGTAVANFHPAFLEAYHSENKLLAITADRPARLRRTGANQTTLHVGLLAPVVTLDCADPTDISALLFKGPAHLNVQFEEPLITDDRTDWLAGLSPRRNTGEAVARKVHEFSPKSEGLLIVGHDRAGFSSEEINAFAKSLGWPIIAEDPVSFPSAIAHAALFLTDSELRNHFKAEQIVVVGRPTLSRSISTLISECREVIVVDPRTSTVDTERKANQVFDYLPTFNATPNQQWMHKWEKLSESAQKAIHLEWAEQLAVLSIIKNLPDECALFIGSSRPVRDVEAFATPRSGVTTFANRGLAGIDGNISCAFGIAEKFARTFAILGDITFLHDLSALVNPSSANLTVFVIDNNGGGIFNTLPQAGVDGFEKIFGTPHNLDLQRIIQGFGFSVSKVKGVSDLLLSINHKSEGLRFVIVEVPDRNTNAQNLKEVVQSLVSALRIGNNLA